MRECLVSSGLSRMLPSQAAAHEPTVRTLRLLLVLVVVAAFLSRFTISVASIDVRPEHVATVLLGGWLLASRPDLLRTAVRDPVVLLLVAFVTWAAATTLVVAPDIRDSAPILGWLALDLVLFASLVALRPRLSIVRDAMVWIIPSLAVLGVAAWVSAQLFDTSWGVQRDSVHDLNAAYATLHEANIYGAVLAVWAVFIIGSRRMSPLRTLAFASVVCAGVLVSETRAAVLGLVLGCLALILVIALQSPRVALRAKVAAPALVIALIAAFYAITAISGVLSEVGSPESVAKPTAAPTGSRASGDPTSPSGTPTPIASPQTEESQDSLTGKLHDFSPSSGNVEYRRLVADIAFKDMTGWRLLVGNGVDTFGQRHDDPTRAGVAGYLSSLPLQVVYDTGMVGATILLSFMIVLLRTVRRASLPVVLGSLTAFAVTATFTSTLWFSTTWLLAGCIAAMRSDEPLPLGQVR
jgi:hypothetical protein